MTSCHVGRRSGLIEENPSLGVEIELAVEPLLALFRDVGAILLGGVRNFFACDPVPVKEPSQRADPSRRAALSQQRLQQPA